MGTNGLKPKIDIEMVEKYAAVGLTEKQIAFLLGFSQDTLTRRKHAIPDLAEAIKRGQLKAEASVSHALYTNAVERHNVTAQIFWLCNRAGEHWINLNKLTIDGTVVERYADKVAAIFGTPQNGKK